MDEGRKRGGREGDKYDNDDSFFFNCSALLHIHTAVTSLELLDMPNDMDQCKGRVISYYSSVLPRIFRVVVRF